MTPTEIKVGPIRPTTGPLAQLGGAAAAQPLGGGSIVNQVEELRQAVLSLQDQLFAQSQLLNRTISVPMLIASGDNHQPGVVPDPGATAGTTKFLREDATFSQVSATGLTGILPVANGGTGTATGSITGTGDLTFTAGGSNKTASLVSSGTGKVVLKPGTDSTTAVQIQNAAGTAVVNVDTSNSNVGIGVTPFTGARLHVHNGTDQNLLFRPKQALADGIALHSINDAVGVTKGMELIGSTIYLNTATVLLALAGVPVYANNAAAIGGGLTAGMLYRTGGDPDPVSIVH